MSTSPKTTISAVVAAYQAERWIGETLDSILGQTRPPDEVIVVDDGSTDGTAAELERFADRIKLVRRENGGCPAAFNTAFAAASGDFVAMCGADDVWHPRKLERQAEAIAGNREADVFFTHAELIGRIEAQHSRPPGTGLLDGAALADALFRECVVCAPSVVIRRSLFTRLGPFVEDFGADDYEYWFRCLRAGARFYYDPEPLVSWRQHEHNLTRQTTWMDQCAGQVRDRYAADVSPGAIARDLLGPGSDPHRIRRATGRLLRQRRHDIGPAKAAAAGLWIAILGLPPGLRKRLRRRLDSLGQAIEGVRGLRPPSLS